MISIQCIDGSIQVSDAQFAFLNKRFTIKFFPYAPQVPPQYAGKKEELEIALLDFVEVLPDPDPVPNPTPDPDPVPVPLPKDFVARLRKVEEQQTYILKSLEYLEDNETFTDVIRAFVEGVKRVLRG